MCGGLAGARRAAGWLAGWPAGRAPAGQPLDGSFEDAEVNLKLPKLAEVSFFKLFQT